MAGDNERNDEIIPTLIPIFRDRWFDHLRSRERRRTLVLLGGGLIVASMVLVAMGQDGISWFGLPAILVLMLLNLTTRVMADAPAAKLDERMVETRNRAFRTAYYALALIVIAVAILGLVFTDADQLTITRAHLLSGVWCAAITTMFLPSAILAWTEEAI